MFKSFNRIKILFNKINIELKDLIKNKEELFDLNDLYNKKKNEIELSLIKEINILNNKILKIDLLNNNKSNFLEQDFKINFDNDFCYHSNYNFNYKNNKSILHSNVKTSNNIKPKEITFDNFKKVLKVEFENFNKINFLQYSFFDNDLNPILPISILYNDYKENNILIDNWNNKIKKETFDNTFNNTFFIDPKDVKYIYFEFDDNINLNESNINFYNNEYEENSEVIYSFPIKNLNGFLLNKNSFEEFVQLDFYYSLDSKDYKILSFENNVARIIFEDLKTIDSLYIKIKRGILKYNEDNKKLSLEEEVINSNNIKENDITFNYGKPEFFNMIIDNEFYLQLNKTLPDLFNKRIDGLIEIKDSYIKEINELSPLQKLSLTNSNSIKIYNENNYPVFYLDKNRYLYLPKCFADKQFSLIYKVETIKDIFEQKDFTPICFDFNLNFI